MKRLEATTVIEIDGRPFSASPKSSASSPTVGMDPETRLWVGGLFRWMNINLAPTNGIVPTKVLANPARAKQAAEKVVTNAVLKGHEFTRADKSIGLMPALAAEGCVLHFLTEFSTFSAACKAQSLL